MVETREALEVDRALEYPASFEATTRRMLQYGQCCAEAAEVLGDLEGAATISADFRGKLNRLRRQQAVLGKLFVVAARDATEAMKAKEAAMVELPMTPSHNRPPASGRFAICEAIGCGHPIESQFQAEKSRDECGNRLCVGCQKRWRESQGQAGALPLEGGETSETPQAFR